MKLRVVFLFILFAALSRLLPHPPNFTPIAAMGLFGAAYLQRSWMAYVVPFVALFLSDLYLNNVVYADLFDGFTWFSSVGIYLSFALVIALSRIILHGNVTAGRVLGSSVLASVVFFLLTNFQSWLTLPFYPKTFSGLLASYTAGIPFFGYTMLGDLVFCTIFFGTYAVVQRRWALRAI